MKKRLPKKARHPFAFFAVVALGATVLVFCSSREHMNERPIIDLGSEPHHLPPKEKGPDELPILDFKKSFFDFDKSALRGDAKAALRRTADWLKENSAVHVQIEGFCDALGSEEYNLKLGLRRANSVLEFLVANGIERERLDAISYGRMTGTRTTERSANRRVELIAIYPSE